MTPSRLDVILVPDPDERAGADTRLVGSRRYLALGTVQRAAIDGALLDGFLSAEVDSRCIYGAAPGARRLLQHESEWYDCAALWLGHCRRTARPSIEVTRFPDGLAQVQMRYGTAAWLQGKLQRRKDIESRLSGLVATRDYRPWRLSEQWVTRALATDDALELARDVVELDVMLRGELLCEYIMEQ